jgi:hypothetical protein
MGWVNPGENVMGGGAANWPNGAFVYQKRDGGFVYYRMAPKPPDSDSVKEGSTFEQLARAALVSTKELDEAITRLAKKGRSTASYNESRRTVQDARQAVVNERSLENHGLTAVMWASQAGIPLAVKRLLDEGAELQLPEGSRSSNNALLLALGHDNTLVVSQILVHRRTNWLNLLFDRELSRSSRVPFDADLDADLTVESRHRDFDDAKIRCKLMQAVATVVSDDTSVVPRQVHAQHVNMYMCMYNMHM